MECPLYQNERDCLSRNLRKTHKNIESLFFGNDEINTNENFLNLEKTETIYDISCGCDFNITLYL